MGAIALHAAKPAVGPVATKAVVRAAERLGLTGTELAGIVGVSGATVSRMRKGDFVLEPGSKPFELALLLVRLFRSLDAIVGGDEKAARSWLTNENLALGGRPVDRIGTIAGLVGVIGYLDARRAVV